MKQLANERTLVQLPDLILTSHRVRLTPESTESSKLISIMLDELASCGVVKTSKPILLWFAALCFLLGIFVDSNIDSDAGSVIGIALPLVFVISYFLTREKVLALASAGETIRIRTQGRSAKDLIEFIDVLEEAKNERYLLRPRN